MIKQTLERQAPHLASDLPQVDPAHDAYGYADFARRIAEAVWRTPAPQGLVMGITGAWGSGKTSMLNFVRHYLHALPEKHRPVLIDFNPWWISDRTHLANQFLAQFQTR